MMITMVIMEMIQRLWLVEKNGQTSFPNLNRKKNSTIQVQFGDRPCVDSILVELIEIILKNVKKITNLNNQRE